MPGVDTEQNEAGRRRPGRPLDPEADRAIIESAVELLSEKGFARLTMDEVAAHAGVGKATIYRRWPSKEALVAAALNEKVAELPVPDTGSVREDLVIYLRALFELWRSPPDPQIFQGLIAELRRNPLLQEPFRRAVTARRAVTRSMLERGIGRGQLRVDVDSEVVLDMLTGSGSYRLLVTGAPFPPDYPDRVVDALLQGLRPR